MIGDVVINIAEEGSVVERIEPAPRRKTFVIILAVELQSLDVLHNDLLEFLGVQSVLNVEPALVIAFNSLHNFIILHFKLLQLTVISLRRLLRFLLFVKNRPFMPITNLLAFPLRFHLTYHVGFKSACQFEQFGNIRPVNDALVVDVVLVLKQVLAVLFEEGIEMTVLQDETEFIR